MSCEFEVDIKPGEAQGLYSVDVLNSPAGEASGKLLLDIQGLLRRRWELQATVLASAVTVRAAVAESERPVREVGEQLFTSLFAGPVYGRYTASLVAAAERGQSLQLVLRVRAPELAALPWETLFDPEMGSYVCQTEPLLRYVSAPAPIRPQEVCAPLRVLGVVAAPRDLLTLDVSEEQHRITAALANLSQDVELEWLTSGRWTDLQSRLLDGPWHVVHFIGHGGFRDGEGVLAMVGPTGAAEYVSAERFTTLLSTAFPPPRLVVLNSCSSGEAGAESLFSSTAAALVRSGVPAAVAMQFAVSDPAAVAFTGGFYAAIAHNRSIGEAVRIGRIAIRGTGERTLEWVTPVLYLRGHDTPLFTVETPTGGQVGPPTGETVQDAARAAAVSSLYTEAGAEWRLGHYDKAVALLDNLLSLDPEHRDATQLRNRIRHRPRSVAASAGVVAADRHGRRRRRLGAGAAFITLIAALATSLAVRQSGEPPANRRPPKAASTSTTAPTLPAVVTSSTTSTSTVPSSTSSSSTPRASRPPTSRPATVTTMSPTSPPPPPPAVAQAPPPSTAPPTTAPPPPATTTTAPAPVERQGKVNGCNTYGARCDDNPIYRNVPPPNYDYRTQAKVATVPNGTVLTARCWTTGGTTWNYAASHNPPDYGPDPYESDVYFYVRAPNGEWGWIPDTYFVRDKQNKMGLPHC